MVMVWVNQILHFFFLKIIMGFSYYIFDSSLKKVKPSRNRTIPDQRYRFYEITCNFSFFFFLFSEIKGRGCDQLKLLYSDITMVTSTCGYR